MGSAKKKKSASVAREWEIDNSKQRRITSTGDREFSEGTV